jgi:hypothetical protein
VITRRTALLALAPISTAALLTGCKTPPSSASAWQQDIQTIDSGLGNVLADLQAIPNPPAALTAALPKIQAELAIIDTNAGKIAAALAPDQTVLQTFDNAVAALVPLATPFFSAAPAVAVAIQAAAALAQVALSEAGIVGATAKITPIYTAARARALLKGTAAK